MAEKYDRDACIQLLQSTHQTLGRYPCRSDLSPEQIVAVKAFLGPLPRALEAAGIKPPRNDGHEEHNREKRIRSKRRRNAQRKHKL